MKIAVIAGEPSGDTLGAELIAALRAKCPDAQIEGVAGSQMRAAGCTAIVPMEDLQVMGFTEVLRHLPRLLKIRRQLLDHWQSQSPDIFIGIDYPEFNFSIEKVLKRRGVKTVHYVSPSVWAWRAWRVKNIATATAVLLTVFPFEAKYYAGAAGLDVQYVGHTLADKIPLQPDVEAARQKLQLPADKKVIALLPGSRRSEWERLSPIFIETAQALHRANPDCIFVAPLVGELCFRWWKKDLALRAPELPVQLLEGDAQIAMIASDVVLLASGTAALEAMLCKKPMVVAYRLSAISYFFAKLLVKLPYVSLPNILAGEKLVPEYLQGQVTVENLTAAVTRQLNLSVEARAILHARYEKMHRVLRCNASIRAAEAILHSMISV